MRFFWHQQRATSVPTSGRAWRGLEAERCRREHGQVTHPHHGGRWRGGIACRNPVVKSTQQANMRWEETSWSSCLKREYTLRQWNSWAGEKTRCEVAISEGIRLEMNTNDAKEYLARREIPQLFEVRDGQVRFVQLTWFHRVIFTHFYIAALPNARRSQGRDISVIGRSLHVVGSVTERISRMDCGLEKDFRNCNVLFSANRDGKWTKPCSPESTRVNPHPARQQRKWSK